MGVEIRRPGSDEWEQRGEQPLPADPTGILVRYPSGIVLEVVGLSEPDASGTRQLQMQVYSPESSCPNPDPA